MNVIGIVAEYNPFHNGHIYQINKVKELFPNSLIIVILNGNFTQRGDVSLINKWDKSKIILEHNVDLVIELPTLYGINNADIFAKGALKILNELKIDALIFGTERDNIDELLEVARVKRTNEYNPLVKEYLDKGYSYPKATFDSLEKLSNIRISTPNDILALSYIEEIINNNYSIKPIGIKRTNDYHSTNLESIASATSIREAIRNKINISNCVPSETLKYINNIFIDDYFNLLKYKILSTDDLKQFYDVKEGIDSRIKKYILESNTLEELIEKVKTKRFTYNRIKRILLYILLDIKKDNKFKDYIRPLGFNKVGAKYLKSIKKDLNLPLVTNYSNNKDLLEFEFKVNTIYSLNSNNYIDSYKSELNIPIIYEKK